MDNRAAKLALARKKLKDHQDKKLVHGTKDQNPSKETTVDDTPPQVETDKHHNIKIVNDVGDSQNIQAPCKALADTDSQFNSMQQSEANTINPTEILILNKRSLEIQLDAIQKKLAESEALNAVTAEKCKISSEALQTLENNFKNLNEKFSRATNDIVERDNIITELNKMNSALSEENSSINEQLEFTKTMLTAKESENNSIYSQLFNLQNQLDATHLQLQQLTNGASDVISNNNKSDSKDIAPLLQKVASLEQQLKDLNKEKDQITSHYQQYVNDLNEQLKGVLKKNEEQSNIIKMLSDRESSLVEQISDMEIRIQNIQIPKMTVDIETERDNKDMQELQSKYDELQAQMNEAVIKYNKLQELHDISNAKIVELSQKRQETSCEHDNISLTKLNADIASDKVAAQLATEQNKKLKQDVQRLEDAFVKMSNDKLELTEMLIAEKDLSKKLAITLADTEEKLKEIQKMIKAKDDEMIRLQSSYRDIETMHEKLLSKVNSDNAAGVDADNDNISLVLETKPLLAEEIDEQSIKEISENTDKHDSGHCSVDKNIDELKNNTTIPKEHAMEKLQERFLKIMSEVAQLSDEKHRLEHIILQLQNETDTICEYVALYQQQRSLLKKRDEERSAQIKKFEEECNKLRTQLEELTLILVRLSEDKDLTTFFQMESRRNDIQRIYSLLTNLKSNSLVDPNKNIDFKNFNPCNCCSGKLIEI